jgi:hypothetical protein
MLTRCAESQRAAAEAWQFFCAEEINSGKETMASPESLLCGVIHLAISAFVCFTSLHQLCVAE